MTRMKSSLVENAYNATRFFTGIGSRETPEDILFLMWRISRGMTAKGWVLRSGHARKADSAFEQGALEMAHLDGFDMEIYLPFENFNNPPEGPFWIDTWHLDNYGHAVELIQGLLDETHWNAMAKKDACGQKLHTRNVYQILGLDLTTPSNVVICYAPETRSGVPKGGTATAIKLARQHNVPVFNLWHSVVREEFERRCG